MTEFYTDGHCLMTVPSTWTLSDDSALHMDTVMTVPSAWTLSDDRALRMDTV